MSERTTPWFDATTDPVHVGFYELHSGDLLHWDGRSWGKWFPEKPGVRFTLNVDPSWRWRGLAEKP